MRLNTHFYWCLWHLSLSYLIPISRCTGKSCELGGSDISGVMEAGDILIGVLVPFHVDRLFQKFMFTEAPQREVCSMFLLEMYQQFQAMRFALAEINGRLDLLPNVTLGYITFESCASLRIELHGTLWMLTGHQSKPIPNYCCQGKTSLAAVLGHSMSSSSILMAHILGLYRYPQISHFSTSSLLSDRTQFPSFFRTVPSDAFQSKGLAHLILHFAWTWVGLIALGNEYGEQGIQNIKKEIVKAGACVAFTEFIIADGAQRNIPYLTKVIMESAAKVVVVFANDIYFAALLDEMLKQKVTGKTFVASEAWSTSTYLREDKYSTILSGTIGFAFHSSTIPGFEHFVKLIRPRALNSFKKSLNEIFWEKTFGCQFPDLMNLQPLVNSTNWCTGLENLADVDNIYTDVSSLRGSFSIYTSVQVIAKSFHDMITCTEGRGPFHNRSCADLQNFKPWQLKYYIQNVQLILNNGRKVFFDKNGNLPAVYDIVNWQVGADGIMKTVKVGSYDTATSDGNTFTLNISAITWHSGTKQVPVSVCSKSCPTGFRKVIRRGEPVCCFLCIPCPPGEISNKTDSADCLKCPWNLWSNAERTKCIPKIIEFLSYEGSLGFSLTATAVISSVITVFILCIFIHYRSTPVIKANNYTLSCYLLLSIALCFLCSLNFIGYPQSEKCLVRQTIFGMAFAICISIILAKTLMVVFAFMAIKPNSRLRKWTSPRVSYMIIFLGSLTQLLICVLWMTVSPPLPEYDTHTQPEVIIAQCNESSPFAFWCMLGYLGLLSFISFIVAFLSRGLPDTFNEAKFITFSMVAFLSVWLSFIPATLSARGQYVIAMEVFAILASSWALVICMFVPKCFILLLKPNMNFKELMGKRQRIL